MMDARWYPAQVHLFQVLTEPELAELERLIQVRAASKGSLVMDPNRSPGALSFVMKGHVRLSKLAPDARPFVVAPVGSGNLFGQAELAIKLVETLTARRERRKPAFENSTLLGGLGWQAGRKRPSYGVAGACLGNRLGRRFDQRSPLQVAR